MMREFSYDVSGNFVNSFLYISRESRLNIHALHAFFALDNDVLAKNPLFFEDVLLFLHTIVSLLIIIKPNVHSFSYLIK